MRELTRPEDAGGLLARLPSVPLGAVIVVADEDVAVLVRGDAAVATLGPGRHELTAEALPAVAEAAFGDVLDAELWFVRSAPLFGVRVGGPAGQFLDPASGIYVRPRFTGEVAVAASDPARLVAALTAGGLPDEGPALLAFVRTQVLEGVRRALTSICGAGAGTFAELDPLLAQLVEQLPLQLDLEDLGLSVGALSSAALTLTPEESAAVAASRVVGAESRVRAIHCPRCGAQARGTYCTQCGGPVNQAG
ncbi:MAG TPA: hypothetical protein VHB21_13810 [Minicystis sp.]|nr:hypothetical protein [Minicystis sp.]